MNSVKCMSISFGVLFLSQKLSTLLLDSGQIVKISLALACLHFPVLQYMEH
jgi:hypothetical protein